MKSIILTILGVILINFINGAEDYWEPDKKREKDPWGLIGTMKNTMESLRMENIMLSKRLGICRTTLSNCRSKTEDHQRRIADCQKIQSSCKLGQTKCQKILSECYEKLADCNQWGSPGQGSKPLNDIQPKPKINS